jgi:hypothetical protein
MGLVCNLTTYPLRLSWAKKLGKLPYKVQKMAQVAFRIGHCAIAPKAAPTSPKIGGGYQTRPKKQVASVSCKFIVTMPSAVNEYDSFHTKFGSESMKISSSKISSRIWRRNIYIANSMPILIIQ